MSLHLTLWKASGEDPWILAECGHHGIQTRFALIGLIGRAVAALSFVSCCYSFAMLFDNIWMAIPVPLIFAWMVNNIYEVLLGTLAKPVLKNKYEQVIKHLSISLRIGFIVFFAVFISKPLEAWLFEGTLSGRVEQLKAAEIRKAEKQIDAQFQKHIAKLEHEISKKQRLHYATQPIQLLQAELTAIIHDRAEALQRIEFVIGRADYFIQRIQLLTSGGVFALSWLVTVSMVILFYPLYTSNGRSMLLTLILKEKPLFTAISWNQAISNLRIPTAKSFTININWISATMNGIPIRPIIHNS